MTTPSVLFVCGHNAGRSQMPACYLRFLGKGRIAVRSAGSQPAESLNPEAVAVMAEEGIEIASQSPELLSTQDELGSDVVITMGCGDACPVFPGKRYEDWDIDDPAGKDRERVRVIRNDIKKRVEDLISGLTPG